MKPADLTVEVRAGHARLVALLGGLTNDEAREKSALPGWSRGHVLTHLADLAKGFTRVTEYCLAGEQVEVYEGGRPARDASIEAGAGRPASELRDDVGRTAEELERAWARAADDDWARSVRYRDGTLLDTLYCRWREVEIHAADLLLGYGPQDWSMDFCDHVVEFLSPRVPAGIRLSLRTDEGCQWDLGSSGENVEVRGESGDIAAWLAGRRTRGSLVTSRGALPALDPWP